MKAICYVFARKEEEGVLRRNIALYAHLFDEVVILCPNDSPVDLDGFRSELVGMSGHSGEESIKRGMEGFRIGARSGYDLIAFTEYDGVFLRKPRWFDGIQSNIHADANVERWGVDFYCHAPVIFSREWLKKFVAGMKLDNRGEWYGDRWLANQVKDLEVPLLNLRDTGEGYSQNTIDERYEEDFNKAVAAGAYCLHGIKSPHILDICYQALK